MKQLIALPLLLSVLAAGALAQEFWTKKPYQEWSPKECRKVLEDSPWARQHLLSRVLIESLTAAPSDRARENNPRVTYTIQFRSARPVRQALVRERQIAMEYDSLSAEQRAGFDKDAETFLSQSFAETIVVLAEYSANITSYQSDLDRIWSTRTEAWAKNQIFLISATGQKISPLRFTRRPGAFQVVFPRRVDGRPVIAESDKEVKIEFSHPTIGILTESRVLEEFKVPKMAYAAKVEY